MQDGREAACFALEEFKQLTIAWVERDTFRSEKELLETKLNLQLKQISTLNSIIDTQGDTITKLTTENDRLFALWVEENKKRHEAETNPSFSWVPWGIASGFAATTLILLVNSAVSN